MNESTLTIQDLTDQTGLPRRTIHFYIQQEILPPAQGSGLGAYYQPEHLVRLKLIPLLRQQGLRLDDIRQKFTTLSPSELENLLTQLERSVEIAPKYLPPPVPAPYQAYNLPQGLILLAPYPLPAALQARFDKLLKTIQTEFQG